MRPGRQSEEACRDAIAEHREDPTDDSNPQAPIHSCLDYPYEMEVHDFQWFIRHLSYLKGQQSI
jgi:hypothetical protein